MSNLRQCPVCGKYTKIVRGDYGDRVITYTLECGHQDILRSDMIINVEDTVGVSDHVEILNRLQPGEVKVDAVIQDGQPKIAISGPGVNASGSGMGFTLGQIQNGRVIERLYINNYGGNVILGSNNLLNQSDSNKLTQGSTMSELATLLTTLQGMLPEAQLPPQKESEIIAEILTIQAQMASSNPKHQIIIECSKTISAIAMTAKAVAPIAIKIAALVGIVL